MDAGRLPENVENKTRIVINLFFTMHGTAMTFLVAMPLIFGFASYLALLMIGTAAFSYKKRPAHHYGIGTLNSPASPKAANRRILLAQRRNRNLIGAS